MNEDYSMFTLGFEGLELENIINAESFSTKWLDQINFSIIYFFPKIRAFNSLPYESTYLAK